MVNLSAEIAEGVWFFYIDTPLSVDAFLSYQSKAKQIKTTTEQEKKNGWVMMNATAYPGTYKKTNSHIWTLSPFNSTPLFLVPFGPSKPQAPVCLSSLQWACL